MKRRSNVRLRGADWVAACVTAILLACVHAGSAPAGNYKMYSCNVPGHGVPLPSTGPWRANFDGPNTRLFDSCAVGGGFGIALEPARRSMRPGSSASLVLERPSAGPKAAIGIVGYRTWLTAELGGFGAPAFISDGGAFSPPGGTTPDESPWISPVLARTNSSIYVQLYCSTGSINDCQFDSATPLTARGIEVDLYESMVPSGSFEGGTLLTGDVQRGRRSVLFSATDEESGIARIELLMGNAVVATDDVETVGAACPHVDFSACRTRRTGTLSVDTSELADGEYTAGLRLTDAAGNHRVIRYADPITVGRASSLGSPPADGDPAVRLTAQFAANSRSSHTVPFGRPARVRGRLRDAQGRPVPNARIVVTEKPDTGDSGRTVHTVTGSDGRFRYSTADSGPSRRIDLKYYGRAASTTPTAFYRLRLRVRTTSTFRVSLRGIVVRYRGRVIAGPIPRGGKQVFIQGRAKGGAWQRFAARWSDAAGRFSGTYRLRVRRPGVRLQFRVEIPRQNGYPYLPHTERIITKTVQ